VFRALAGLFHSARLRPRLPRPSRSLRTAFAVSFAAMAALVTMLIGFLSYDAASRMVRVDQQSVFHGVVLDLQQQVEQQHLGADDYVTSDPDHDGPRDDLTRRIRTDVQVLGPGGRIADRGSPKLPVSASDRATAEQRSAGHTVRYKVTLDGGRYRVATVALGGGRGAVQVAQRYGDVEDLLEDLQRRTALLTLTVVSATGLAGWWLARRITGRLVRLTGIAETVAETGQLDVNVPVSGRDEVGRLGRAFDDMLGRLARSEEDQRRLVQDAGHELRTPLTSLRTNISLLRRLDELPPEAGAELIEDMAGETRELSDLVDELVELAAGHRYDEEPTEVSLREVAEQAAAVTERRTGRQIVVRADDTVLEARSAALQRALSNLLENAAKFDREGTEPIEVVAHARALEVRDRGPGVPEADLTRIFDRFYRADKARSLPGSGLGLSIVREVAVRHGGTTFARNRAGGGAVIGFTIGGPIRRD
jgi:two-component system, OmpR family, sensor histidine kinase MprB